MSKRYTQIDGIYVEVDCCDSCPFYDGGDDGYADHCQYPNNKASFCSAYRYSEPDVAEDCPLRVKE